MIVGVTQSISEQGSNHGGHAVECQEKTHAEWLLAAGVEHGCDVHDSRRDARLKHAQNETEDHHSRIVLRRNMAHQDDSPDKQHHTSVLGDGKFLDEYIGRECPEKVAKVEDGGSPGVTLAAALSDDGAAEAVRGALTRPDRDPPSMNRRTHNSTRACLGTAVYM